MKTVDFDYDGGVNAVASVEDAKADASMVALIDLGRALSESGYRFTCPTPETCRRVNARPNNHEARTLVDVFGWSRGFRRGMLDQRLFDLLLAAQVYREHDGLCFSTVRCSSIDDALYFHSAFPTTGSDAVFFGPDTYRFATLLANSDIDARRAVDVGCGSGAGGLTIAARCRSLVMSDINPQALRLARVNAALAGAAVDVRHSDVLADVTGDIDLVIANPPYLVDSRRRLYRDGGGARGIDLSVRIVTDGLARLCPGGRVIVYTGVPIIDGTDPFLAAITPLLEDRKAKFTYRELDPDVFGEELDNSAYDDVDRIAVVALDALVP